MIKLLNRFRISYNLRLLLTYLFVIFVLHVVPVDIFYMWGWGEPIIGQVTISNILSVLKFIPWMIIAWIIIYEGYPDGMPKYRFLFHTMGWLFLGMAFALFAEMSQLILPHRNFLRLDAILKCAGVLLGTVTLMFNPNKVWKNWLESLDKSSKKKSQKNKKDKGDVSF